MCPASNGGYLPCGSLGAAPLMVRTAGPQPVSQQPWTPLVLAALGTTVQTIKTSSGTLGVEHCDNGNSATEYIEFFNVSNPTLGTTAPVWFSPIPAGGGGDVPAPGVTIPGAIYAVAVTAYNGSTAPATTLNCAIGYL